MCTIYAEDDRHAELSVSVFNIYIHRGKCAMMAVDEIVDKPVANSIFVIYVFRSNSCTHIHAYTQCVLHISRKFIVCVCVNAFSHFAAFQVANVCCDLQSERDFNVSFISAVANLFLFKLNIIQNWKLFSQRAMCGTRLLSNAKRSLLKLKQNSFDIFLLLFSCWRYREIGSNLGWCKVLLAGVLYL